MRRELVPLMPPMSSCCTRYDERLLSGVYNNKVLKNVQRLVRDVRLALLFPSESLWEPVFRWWHFFWRRKMNKLARAEAQ